MRPDERSLVKKLEGKPFALIGIAKQGGIFKNLKEFMDQEKMNWRSFVDDGISARWNVRGTPTLYIIDPKGVIQYKWGGNPGPNVIDAALAELIKNADLDRKDKSK